MKGRKSSATQAIIFSFIGSCGEGYSACAQGHQIFTRAETIAELRTNIRDAVIRHFGEAKRRVPFRLVRSRTNRVLGSAKGEFTVPDDFNEPLPKEIEDLFYR